MSLPVDLAAASREDLIEVVGQLLRYVGALEARIKELEDRRKPLGRRTCILGTMPSCNSLSFRLRKRPFDGGLADVQDV